MKSALILEGGGMRALYTAGVLDVLMENGIETDVAAGVSAGALFGINYKSKQIGRVLRYNLKYAGISENLGLKSLIKTGDLMNREFYFNELPFKLDVMDAETYKNCKTQFYAVVTNLNTGLPEYIDISELENPDCIEYLRASGSLPFVTKPVTVNGIPYLDGGISDSIPVKHFMDEGYDKIVVILTKPHGFKIGGKIPGAGLAYKNYPAFAKVLKSRNFYYTEQLEYVNQLEKDNKIIVIRPSEFIKVGTTEKNRETLQSIYDLGVKDCKEKLGIIEKYLEI